MISVFIEAALRSLLAGLTVAVGLRIFRVRNVLAQKVAWGLVLVSAIAMPLLLPITAQWRLVPSAVTLVLPAHPMTLLEELQARIVAKHGAGNKTAPVAVPVPQSAPPAVHGSPAPERIVDAGAGEPSTRTDRAHRAAKQERNAFVTPDRSRSGYAQPTENQLDPVQKTKSLKAPPRNPISPILLVIALYCGIAALLLLRLILGLFNIIRLWRTGTPIPRHELPLDAASLRIRASSKVGSPLTIGSAILLPADYKDWDREKLRIVLAHECSHVHQGDFYLQLAASLYVSVTWLSPLGWWLRHELAELAEAISDLAGMEEATSRTSYAQILLEFAAAPRQISLGVAMSRPGSLSRRIERLLNDNSFRQCFAGGRRTLLTGVLVPVALVASTTMVRVQAAAARQSASPASVARAPKAAPSFLAAPQFDTLQAAPAVEAVQPGGEERPQLPTTPAVLPVLSNLKTASPEPLELIAIASQAPMLHMTAPAIAMAARGMEDSGLSFDRTLPVHGNAQLMISTGSGNIQIRRGSGDQVHIHGHIRVNRGGSQEQAQQIATNPPIEQNGDTIHVGQHQEQWRGISIDYQIEAPAGTLLGAISGSGDIVDDGVGRNAKLQTGSGDIRAIGLEGPFTVKTGSGNITAAQTGQGDVVAETGSGDIEIKEIHGGFHGQTGSGDIKAGGTPSAPWALLTGSGNVELWTGSAPLTLDASTDSGSVSTDHEMMVQGTFDRHHIRGNLNGGGPTVRVQTGSGDIQIH